MAQRTSALWREPATGAETIIGIESIFTVINGKQINIPGKVEALREKGRNNELYCPCGCGLNLTLVAGDRGLREQHFRVKPGQEENETKCTVHTESIASMNEKIVIKCWLDDILKAEVKTRVPISLISDSTRKYELTFYSPEKKVAVCFYHMRENISDEKLQAVEENTVGVSTFYIVSSTSIMESSQYPEWLHKIMLRQKICLAVYAPSIDYDEARLSAFIYEKDECGIWRKLSVCDAKLSEFGISNGRLMQCISDVEDLAEETRNEFRSNRVKRQAEREKLNNHPTKQTTSPLTDTSSGDKQGKTVIPDGYGISPVSPSARAIKIRELSNIPCRICGGMPVQRGSKYYCNSCGKVLFDLRDV